MSVNLDYSTILENLIFFLAGGGIVWMFKTMLKLRRDTNVCFRKLRKLYKDTHGEAWLDKWED